MLPEVLPNPDTSFGRRVRERLNDERVVWFTSVGRDGTPQPNPVWFIWTGENEIITYNRPDAHRLSHIEHRPLVSLHFNCASSGNDVVVFRGPAERVDTLPAPHRSSEYLAKYENAMIDVSGSVEEFAAVYFVPVRVHVTRVRGF